MNKNGLISSYNKFYINVKHLLDIFIFKKNAIINRIGYIGIYTRLIHKFIETIKLMDKSEDNFSYRNNQEKIRNNFKELVFFIILLDVYLEYIKNEKK